MPDKEGSEDEKTTKGVVKKKTKQMLNQEYIPEEEYDHYKDRMAERGIDISSKDKKDATTLPQSKRKKVKGDTVYQAKLRKKHGGKIPSALDLVKADITKKYGKGAIMNVGKKKANEELDLTKVAEAFGGYIVEAPMKSLTGNPEEIEKRIKKGAAEVTGQRKEKGAKALAKDAGIKLATQGPEQAAATQAFKDMRMSGDRKFSDLTPDTKTGMRATAAGKGRAEPEDEMMASSGGKKKGEFKALTLSPTSGGRKIRKKMSPSQKEAEPVRKRGRRAERVPDASGGKKTGSLRKGNLEFPGDRTGATQQAKSDIDQKELLKKAGASGDIGFRAPNRPEKVKKRTDRADAQGTPDPWMDDTSSAAADNAKKFGTPVPPRQPRFDNREPFQDDDLGQRTGKTGDKIVNTAPAGKGRDKGTPQKGRPIERPAVSGEFRGVGTGRRDVIPTSPNRETNKRAATTFDQEKLTQAQTGVKKDGTYMTKDERRAAFAQSKGVENVKKNLTRGAMPRDRDRDLSSGFKKTPSGNVAYKPPSTDSPNVSTGRKMSIGDIAKGFINKIDTKRSGEEFQSVMTKSQDIQRNSKAGAGMGLLTKTAIPQSAGAEAGLRYARGDKGGAMLSAIQSTGGPIGFAAGVINAYRSMNPAAFQRTPKPNTKVTDIVKAQSTPSGGDRSPETTGEKEAMMVGGGMVASDMFNRIKNRVKNNLKGGARGLEGGRVGRRSAKQ